MLTIDKNEVLRYLGYRDQTLDYALDKRIDGVISLCCAASSEKYLFDIFDVEETNGILLRGTTLVLSGESISRHMHGAKKIAVLAATLGIGFDMEFKRLQSSDMSAAVIFDAAGSSAIEEVVDKCESEIKQIAKGLGFTANSRFSAGYGDLPIELQKDIIETLNASKRIGLTVTESSMMLPQKSVTAFIGLFEGGERSE